MTGEAYAKVVAALAAAGRPVAQDGTDAVRSSCPGHDGDGRDALRVARGDAGVLTHCFARECPAADIMAGLGLKVADLFDNPRGREYVYDDGRHVHRTPGKKFRQSGNRTGTPTLYRAGEVVDAVATGLPVWLVEGEKDAENLRQIAGVTATTAPQGANNFGKADVSPLRGAHVHVIVDRDDAGRGWAAQVAARLDGVAASLTWHQAHAGKDASDHLAAGLTLDQLAPCSDAPQPRPEARPVTLSSVAPERVAWLWPGYLPVGKLVVIDGDPSVGKSTLTNDLAARVSTGRAWPDGAPNAGARGVLLLSAEDGLADTIVPRLTAAGADLTRVHALTEVLHLDEGEVRHLPPSLPRDIAVLRDSIARLDVGLVVVDVLMAYLNGKVDSHRDQDVRGVLHQLATMAEATACTVVLIRHLNKATGGSAMYRGGGSIGIIGAARAAYVVGRDPEDQSRRILACTKNNLAPEPPSLAYRLESDDALDCARVAWEAGTVALTAADLVRGPRDEDEAGERNEAERWLTDYLTDRGGQALAGDAIKAALAVGIAKTTLHRARKAVGVESKKAGRGWVWELALDAPEESTPHPEESTQTPPTRGSGIFAPTREGSNSTSKNPRFHPTVATDVVASRDVHEHSTSPQHSGILESSEPSLVGTKIPHAGVDSSAEPSAEPAGTPLRFGSTACADCGNDLLAEHGALQRCRDRHRVARMGVAR